jgi:cytochrome d ubiquinol oxidase subunit I
VFWKKRNELNKWLLGIIALGAPMAFLGVELGWFYAELGRQPWIIRGYMRVEEAATSSPNIRMIFFFFLLLYIVLGVMCVLVLRRLFNNNPAEVEMEKWMKEKRNQSTEKGERA